MRAWVRALLIVLTLLAGTVATAAVTTQTVWFKNWLRGYIEREAGLYLDGHLTIGRLGGDLFSDFQLEDIRIETDGQPAVTVKDISLDYSVFELISRGISLDKIRINQPVVFVRREGDSWSLARLIKRQEQEADRQGPLSPIAVRTVSITDGTIAIEAPAGSVAGVRVPQRVDKIDAQMSFDYRPVRYSLTVGQLSFRTSDPALALNRFSGGLAVRDDTVFLDNLAIRTAETSLAVDGAIQHYLTKPDLNLQISSEKVSLPELSALLPGLSQIDLKPSFDMKLSGPLDKLRIDAGVKSDAGVLDGSLVADLQAPGYAAKGTVSVRQLDLRPLAPLLKMPSNRTDITATAQLDVQSDSVSDPAALKGTASVDASRLLFAGYAAKQLAVTARLNGRQIAVAGRVDAYGAEATATGLVTLKGEARPLAYDLKGRAEHLDIRRLPATLNLPTAETSLSGNYRLHGVEPTDPAARRLDGSFTFDDSTAAGARIKSGSTAAVSMKNGEISYQADASIDSLNLARIGQAFNLAALSSDRYTSEINGHIIAEGSGTAVREMRLDASGTLNKSTILGGRLPQLSFTAQLSNDTAHIVAAGPFEQFDPAVVAGRPELEGIVSGTLDVNATIAQVSSGVSADQVTGTARMDLTPSTIGGLTIAKATLDADYADQSGQVRTFEIEGPDLNVKATGTLALNETGQSNLEVHADTTNLESLGRLFDVPVAGIARADATITGNRAALAAKGTLAGNSLTYQDNGALTLSSNFDVQVPSLAFDHARIDGDTHATFVTVAGQNINELTGKTTYQEKTVEFDATARQPERTLTAGGALTLEADRQQVRLQSLDLQTRGLQWQLAPGTAATIGYAGDTIDVAQLRLVSADQAIDIDGTLGHAGERLNVRLSNVDLANVDALLLRAPQFTGRVNASAEVSGPRSAPAVIGTFEVAKGGFRQFKYDTFSGTLDYAGKGLTIDARLQQNATQWMTAKGYVPVAAFRAAAGDNQAAPQPALRRHVPPASPEDAFNLSLDSSPIDLGVVQGFTSAVTDVTGTLEAHLRITGSGQDPHPEGTVSLQDGAATVEAGGVRYTAIGGRIDLQPDRVHIDRISAVDNHQSPLSIAGDLALHEGEIGAVSLRIEADDFKVIDNEIGNVRVDSRLGITGELRAPRLEGDLSVTTGTINLDEIIALTGSSAYATKPIEFETPQPGQAAEAAPVLNPFDALQMDVHFTVPDDLLVKASELQAAGAPIGLGALSVTLGGDLRATKAAGGPVRLAGDVSTIRGTYQFQGRRFEILRDGAVRFDGTEEFNPTLDLRTLRVIQGVEARVTIRGTLRQPEVVLSSTPPLEQADILSLIVFNQPINELGQEQQASLMARAEGLAAGAVAGQLAQSIGNALGLETFELNLAPENGSGPQLTLGQQLGQSLYLKVEQQLGSENATNVILEYAFTNWLRLQTNVIQNTPAQTSPFRRVQGTGADLIFQFSH